MKPVPINIYELMGGAVLDATIVIFGVRWLIKQLQNKTPYESLMSLASIGFIVLVLVWAIDKVVIVQRPLLTEDESKQILNLVQTLITIIFTYYFVKTASKKEQE